MQRENGSLEGSSGGHRTWRLGLAETLLIPCEHFPDHHAALARRTTKSLVGGIANSVTSPQLPDFKVAEDGVHRFDVFSCSRCPEPQCRSSGFPATIGRGKRYPRLGFQRPVSGPKLSRPPASISRVAPSGSTAKSASPRPQSSAVTSSTSLRDFGGKRVGDHEHQANKAKTASETAKTLAVPAEAPGHGN